MAQEGNGRSNAHHGFTKKGEDSKKGNELRIKMHHMDLIVGKHNIEEGGERGNQTSPQGVDEESNLRGEHGTQAKPSSFRTRSSWRRAWSGPCPRLPD